MTYVSIIEREPSFQKIFTGFFNSLGGYTISSVFSNTDEILNATERPKHLDIIIYSVYRGEDPEQLRLLKKQYPNVRIIISLASAENSLVVSSLKNHADGLVLKSDGLYPLHSAIVCSMNHGLYISPILFKILTEHLFFHFDSPQSIDFSAKEKDIIRLAKEGLSYKQMATQMKVTPFTINHHLKRIYKKAGVNSRSQLMVLLQKVEAGIGSI